MNSSDGASDQHRSAGFRWCDVLDVDQEPEGEMIKSLVQERSRREGWMASRETRKDA